MVKLFDAMGSEDGDVTIWSNGLDLPERIIVTHEAIEHHSGLSNLSIDQRVDYVLINQDALLDCIRRMGSPRGSGVEVTIRERDL